MQIERWEFCKISQIINFFFLLNFLNLTFYNCGIPVGDLLECTVMIMIKILFTWLAYSHILIANTFPLCSENVYNISVASLSLFHPFFFVLCTLVAGKNNNRTSISCQKTAYQ